MSWRYPRHERTDEYEVRDGIAVVACRCGWTSTPVPIYQPGMTEAEDDAAWEIRRQAWDAHVAPLITPHPDLTLDLRRDEGGWRHHLAGEPVHNGAALELLLPTGAWWPGHYETTRGADYHRHGPTPMFYASLGGAWADNGVPDYALQVCFPLPVTAVLRRPPRQERW
jgi:hypothetical protein